jgi:excisionase family DNA binding protein
VSRPEPLTEDELRSRHTITVCEYAATVGVAPDTVYDAAGRGELRVLRIGRRVLVPTVAVLAELGLSAADEPLGADVDVDEPPHGCESADDERTAPH